MVEALRVSCRERVSDSRSSHKQDTLSPPPPIRSHVNLQGASGGEIIMWIKVFLGNPRPHALILSQPLKFLYVAGQDKCIRTLVDLL